MPSLPKIYTTLSTCGHVERPSTATTSTTATLLSTGMVVGCVDLAISLGRSGRAIINGRDKSIKWLLAHDADVNAKDSMGWTPLHHTACQGKVVLTQSLLQCGADASLKNNKGKTPGMMAAVLVATL